MRLKVLRRLKHWLMFEHDWQLGATSMRCEGCSKIVKFREMQ